MSYSIGKHDEAQKMKGAPSEKGMPLRKNDISMKERKVWKRKQETSSTEGMSTSYSDPPQSSGDDSIISKDTRRKCPWVNAAYIDYILIPSSSSASEDLESETDISYWLSTTSPTTSESDVGSVQGYTNAREIEEAKKNDTDRFSFKGIGDWVEKDEVERWASHIEQTSAYYTAPLSSSVGQVLLCIDRAFVDR